MARLEVVLVPARSDNYVYLLHDSDSGATAVVDPGEAAPVIAALDARGWKPSHIINTHHHGDHIEGNEAARATYGCTPVGPESEAARECRPATGVPVITPATAHPAKGRKRVV